MREFSWNPARAFFTVSFLVRPHSRRLTGPKWNLTSASDLLPFLASFFFFFFNHFMSSALHPSKYQTSHTLPVQRLCKFPKCLLAYFYWLLYFLGTLLWSCLSCCSVTRKQRAPIHSSPPGFSVVSNRNKTPPTCTSPTCRCQWTSRSWRTCWSPSVRPFPHVSSVTPMEPAEEWALPGTRFQYFILCFRTAGWSWLVVV